MDPTSRTFLTSQFRARCFGLDADKPSLLGTCQSGGQQLVYLVYRGVLCLFWTIIMLISWSGINGKYFLFLTHWGLFFLCASTALQLAGAVYLYIKQRRETLVDIEKRTPILLKINWVIYNVASVLALVISIVYYSAIGRELKFLDMAEHALTSLYVLADVFVTGVPVRVLHTWHTMLFFLCYIFATVFYWGATGKSLYDILDYEESPGDSAMTVIILFLIGVPLVHLILFLLYWLRVYLWQRLCSSPPEDEVDDSPMRTVSQFRQTRDENGRKSNHPYAASDIEEPTQEHGRKSNHPYAASDIEEPTQEQSDSIQIRTENSDNVRRTGDSEPHYAVPTTSTNRNSYLDNMSRRMYGQQHMANPIYSVVDPRHSQAIPASASSVYANIDQGVENRAFNDSMV